jgi:hypothetical protein
MNTQTEDAPSQNFSLNFNRVFRQNYVPVKILWRDMSISMRINTSLVALAQVVRKGGGGGGGGEFLQQSPG